MSMFRKTKSSDINLDWGRKNINSKRDMDRYWENISRNFNLTQDNVRQFPDKINWLSLSMNKQFPFDDDFLTEFADRIEWNAYAIRHDMPEEQFIKFKRYIDPVYFILGKKDKAEKQAMAEKYWSLISPTEKLIRYNEERASSDECILTERQALLWPNSYGWISFTSKAPISWDFTANHIESEEDWEKFSNTIRDFKLIQKYWDKLDKEALLYNMLGTTIDGEVPASAQRVIQKLKPYLSKDEVERVKKELHRSYYKPSKFMSQFYDEFDNTYNKIKEQYK